MARLTHLADTLNGNRWEHFHLLDTSAGRTELLAHSAGAILVAAIAACFVLTFAPVALDVFRRIERRITRWVEQDAPRPVVPTAAGHDTNPAEEVGRG